MLISSKENSQRHDYSYTTPEMSGCFVRRHNANSGKGMYTI